MKPSRFLLGASGALLTLAGISIYRHSNEPLSSESTSRLDEISEYIKNYKGSFQKDLFNITLESISLLNESKERPLSELEKNVNMLSVDLAHETNPRIYEIALKSISQDIDATINKYGCEEGDITLFIISLILGVAAGISGTILVYNPVKDEW